MGLAAMALLGAAAAFGSGFGAAGARAAAVLALLAVAAALLGRRPASHSAPSLSLDARQPLGRDCGVAVVRSDGRRFLVGYGTAGATVLAELSREEAP